MKFSEFAKVLDDIEAQTKRTKTNHMAKLLQAKIEKNAVLRRNILEEISDQQKTQKQLDDETLQRNTPNVRKSRRLHEKSQSMKKQKHQDIGQSVIKKLQRSRKREENTEYERDMFSRLSNPGNATLRAVIPVLKDNEFYYSIEVRKPEFCSRHWKESQTIEEEGLQNCAQCKMPGKYWFSSTELQKFNNGNFIRRYMQGFL